MKTAKELLDEIVGQVLPPPRSVITLAENKLKLPNWEANFSSMPIEKIKRFRKIVAMLAESVPHVDWTSETIHSGSTRRTVHYRGGGSLTPKKVRTPAKLLSKM